jgi:hypothetical protein
MQTDCWNESAAQAGCDPNVDDACLCGVFSDLVTSCVSETCSIEDNLGMLFVSSSQFPLPDNAF